MKRVALEAKKISDAAIGKLLKTDFSLYPEICDILNHWKWDDRLGEKPEGWDALPYSRPLEFWARRKEKLTKYIIIHPVIKAIEDLAGEKSIFRYHHLHNLHRTELQFEDWYSSYHRDW